MPQGIYKHKKGYKRPPITEEWRANLSKSHLGKMMGEDNPSKRKEVREKISIALQGNKNSLGFKHSQESIEKQRLSNMGDKNPAWKGEKVSYRELHKWVKKYKGTPNKCEHCGKTNLRDRQYNWANKSHTYKRDLEDWIRLCGKCHKKYDREQN